MADRVQVIKWETIGGGGSQEDSFPSAINPNEDGIEARELFIQNDTSEDEVVSVSRDASDNMTFQDGVVAGTKTLSDLLAGAGFDEDTILTSRVYGETLVSRASGNVLVQSQ